MGRGARRARRSRPLRPFGNLEGGGKPASGDRREGLEGPPESGEGALRRLTGLGKAPDGFFELLSARSCDRTLPRAAQSVGC